MSKQTEDIIMKSIMELFKGDAVKFFGINKQIVSATTLSAETRTELLHIHIQKNIDDWLLEADDNSFLHFEFQSDYDPKDLKRFMVTDAMLYYKEGKPIKTIVVYTADIEETVTELDAGSIQYSVDTFYMSALDGDQAYTEIKAKVAAGEPLTKQDLMSIVFMPMMKSSVDKVTKFERAITLSKEISDTDEQIQIQAMLKLLADKFVKDPKMMQRLRELINMTAIGEMILRDGIEQGIERGAKDKEMAIATSMLKDGMGISIVAKHTTLSETTIQELKKELDALTAA